MNKKAIANLTRQHSVLGAISACFLIIVFAFGGFLFFRGELSVWQLAWQTNSHAKELDMTWQSAIVGLLNHSPELIDNRLTLTADSTNTYIFQVYIGHDLLLYNNQTQQLFDGRGDSQYGALSDFLYFFHIHLTAGQIGATILGVACILLMMVCISGILIRWRHLVSKFHEYRIMGRPQHIFKDAHILLGIGAFIFCLVYGVTSAAFNLNYRIISPVYTAFAEKEGKDPWVEMGYMKRPTENALGKKLTLKTVKDIISSYQAQYPEHHFTRFDIYSKPVPHVRIEGESYKTFDFLSAYYDVQGNLISDPINTAYQNSSGLMTQLHEGHILGKASNLIYFVLTLISLASMILGNLYWIMIRERKRAKRTLFKWQRAFLEPGSNGALFVLALLLTATKFFAADAPMSNINYQLILLFGFFFCGCLVFIFTKVQQSSRFVLLVSGFLYLLLPLVDLTRYFFGYEIYAFAIKDFLTINLLILVMAWFCFALNGLVGRISKKVNTDKGLSR